MRVGVLGYYFQGSACRLFGCVSWSGWFVFEFTNVKYWVVISGSSRGLKISNF